MVIQRTSEPYKFTNDLSISFLFSLHEFKILLDFCYYSKAAMNQRLSRSWKFANEAVFFFFVKSFYRILDKRDFNWSVHTLD